MTTRELEYEIQRLRLLVAEARILLMPPLLNMHPAMKPQWVERRDTFMEESA